MNVRPSTSIDLTPYGVDDVIVIGTPMLSAQWHYKNEVGKRCKVTVDENGHEKMENCPAGDLELLEILAYVHSAPFKKKNMPVMMSDFLSFTDKMDEEQPGLATEMYNELYTTVQKYKGSGENSPFQD